MMDPDAKGCLVDEFWIEDDWRYVTGGCLDPEIVYDKGEPFDGDFEDED